MSASLSTRSAWPLTLRVSPALASAGRPTSTFTLPLISVRSMVPSLLPSSVITTVGAPVAVVSPMVALSLPSAETLPAPSTMVAVTVRPAPSAGRSNS